MKNKEMSHMEQKKKIRMSLGKMQRKQQKEKKLRKLRKKTEV